MQPNTQNFLFQVETIGDAYCVASGLHRRSDTHAQQIAWMALKMIETCTKHQTHDGKPIKVSRALFVLCVHNLCEDIQV